MNMTRLIGTGLICILTSLATGQAPQAEKAAAAAPKSLGIGDEAPGLKIAKFFKGDPVTAFEPGKTYVMEFWATWCGPCIQQIPHLAKLQSEYADQNVQIVSTAIWQREDTQALREKKVGDFVQSRSDAMAYTVAIDDESWMSDHWMEPAGRNGIPSAFVVGKTGLIEWIGHPVELDQMLAQYADGTWDRDAARAALDEARRFEKMMREFQRRFMTAMQAGNRTDAAAVLEEAAKEFPDNEQIKMMRFEFYLQDAKTAGSGCHRWVWRTQYAGEVPANSQGPNGRW